MAKLALSILGWVRFQIAIIFHLVVSTKGDSLTPPTNVHFQMGFFHHILNWSHNRSDSVGILYQVEYCRYGAKWISVPNCSLISQRSCDLTVETLPKGPGYFAQVRSVLGDQVSEWAHTTRYTFKDVDLPPPSVHVDVDGPSLHVQLTLPKLIVNDTIKRFEDVFPYHRMYTIDIRRTSDSHMFQQVKYCERFHITDLVEGQEYCLIIQPSITSRGNIGEASSEICIFLPEQGVSSSTLLVVASCILTFVVLLILVNIFICHYIRRVVKTPTALKSLIQRSWSWMDKPPSPVIETTLHWENGPFEHLMAEPRNSLMRSSADSGFGSQIFVGSMSKSSREPSVGESVANSDITGINIQEKVFCEKENTKCEDSGISLSTDSQNLSCDSDSSDDKDIQSCGNCSETVVVIERLGYLRQQELEENTNTSNEELEKTWQPQIKEYLSQIPQNQQKSHVELPLKTEFDSMLEPWTQLPETIQSLLPLTVAFSPFSNKCWDLGVSGLSLGDLELIDTRS